MNIRVILAIVAVIAIAIFAPMGRDALVKMLSKNDALTKRANSVHAFLQHQADGESGQKFKIDSMEVSHVDSNGMTLKIYWADRPNP